MAYFLSFFTDHWIVSLFLLANLTLGFWAHSQAKRNSFEDYALASRSLPTGVLTLSMLATMVTVGSMWQSGYAYSFGVAFTFNQVCGIVQLICIGTFIAPCLVHFPSCMTIGDLMRTFYGRAAQLLAGILSCLFCILIVSTQMNGIGKMSYALFGVPPSVATMVFGGLIILYSVWGGMRSVSYTDVLQAVALLIVFSWITQAILQRIGGVQELVQALPKEKSAFLSYPGFFQLARASLVWSLYPFSSMAPPLVQRMLMTRDKRTVRKVWYTNAFLKTFISCMVVLIGLSAVVGMKKVGLTGKEGRGLLWDLIPKLFTQGWVVDCMFIGCLAILFSTMDSYLHTLGITFVQDIITPLFGHSSTRSPCFKTLCARVTITFAGLLTIAVSLIQIGRDGSGVHWYIVALLLSVMLVVPLIIGILGLKTDGASLVTFCAVYLASLLGFRILEWPLADYFYPSILFSTLAYFTTHIYRNGGIVTLKRSKQTLSERLWIPSWQSTFCSLKSWFFSPLQLHKLASRKIVNAPIQSLPFSIFIFAVYTLSSVITSSAEDQGVATFMAALHMIGITLCSGLMLEGIWPHRWKRYFPLYWFVTLFYCLPFGGTLAFLRAHEGPISTLLFGGSFVLLLFLVDSQVFCLLAVLGSLLATISWYLFVGHLPYDLWNAHTLTGMVILTLLLISTLLFIRRREQHAAQRLLWNRSSSGILVNDLRNTLQMQNGIGTLLQGIFRKEKGATNRKGESRRWVSKEHAQLLRTSGEELVKKSNETRQDIHNFLDFMECQVMGWLEKEKIQMGQLIKEVLKRAQDKYKDHMKITLSCSKDFAVHTFSAFSNVIADLLDNASRHGKATEVQIGIDGTKRTLTLRDNGEGIAPELLPRIFDFNFHTELQERVHSGLGLAFIKMVVHASSGQIFCHSRAGDNHSFTEFVMTFSKP